MTQSQLYNGIIGINDQSQPFMFEVMDTATSLPSDQYILPINPEAYRKIETTRATVTQTKGGGFEDNVGMGLAKMSLSGTFGFLGTLPGGGGQSLSPEQKDGWGLFKEIESIFLRFYDRFGTYNDAGTPVANPVDPQHLPELRFYNFTDDDYYVVQINKFEISRNNQRKFLYQYDIQMTALRRLLQASSSASDAVAQMLSQIPVPASLSLWQTLLQGYGAVYSGMSDIVNTVTSIEQNITIVAGAVNGFLQGTTDMINCPAGLLQTVTSAVDSILNKIQDTPAIPYEFTGDLRDTKRTMLQLGLHADMFSATSTTASATNGAAILDSTEILTAPLPQNAAEQGVVTMNIPETTMFDPALETTAEVAASEYPINYDDTIQSIAQKMLGDATAWMRIALLNDMEYPFIVRRHIDAFTATLETGTLAAPATACALSIVVNNLSPKNGDILLLNDGVKWEPIVARSVNSVIVTIEAPLKNSYAQGTPVTRHQAALSVMLPGDKIQIPGGANTGAPIAAGGGQDDFYTRIYGTDEFLSDDGTHSADSSGDIATLSGLDNLGMALQHRLRTVRGELASLGHPQYGSYLPLIIGKISVPMWLQRAILEAKITIQEDPRIAKVGAARLAYAGTSIILDADVYPVNQTAATQMSIVVG